MMEEFWKTKTLEQMNTQEWESLCDGCGKCCLVRLENAGSGQVHDTCIACRLLDTETCRCKDYANRHKRVPDCLVLRPLDTHLLELLPDTCAYRLLDQGRDLPHWHPLVSGNPQTVVDEGISVAGKVIPEQFVHPDEVENCITWPNTPE